MSTFAALFLSALYLGAAAYWLRGMDFSSMSTNFVVFVAIFMTIGLGLGVSTMAPKRWRTRALIATVWFGLAVYTSEFVLTATLLTRSAPDRVAGVEMDQRTPLQVVRDLRKEGSPPQCQT